MPNKLLLAALLYFCLALVCAAVLILSGCARRPNHKLVCNYGEPCKIVMEAKR